MHFQKLILLNVLTIFAWGEVTSSEATKTAMMMRRCRSLFGANECARRLRLFRAAVVKEQSGLMQLKERQFYNVQRQRSPVSSTLSTTTSKAMTTTTPKPKTPGQETLADIRANILQMSVFGKNDKVGEKQMEEEKTTTFSPSLSHIEFPVFTFINGFDPLGQIVRKQNRIDGETTNDREKTQTEKAPLSSLSPNWYYDNGDDAIVTETNLIVTDAEEPTTLINEVDAFPSGFPQYFDDEVDLRPVEEKRQATIAEAVKASVGLHTCSAECTCVCPKHEKASNVAEKRIDSNKDEDFDVDISLYPCARSAGYRLNLAMKLCRRRRKML